VSSIGYIKNLLNTVEDVTLRNTLSLCFEEAIRQGRIGDQKKAENMAWFQVEFTTAAVANTEFSVEHKMDTIPSRFIPSMRLNVVNAQLVPLQVSRASDAKRAYFKSTSTSATVQGHFE